MLLLWIPGGIRSFTTLELRRTSLDSWQPVQVYRAEAPTSGTWAVGDIVWNTAPAAAGTLGWVCTTAGTPGTWRTFGGIA